MKRVSWSAGLAVVLLCGCLEKGARSATETPFLQLHWAGTTAISTNGTNAAKLQQVLKLQSTMDVRTQAMAKLARVPQELWQKTLGRRAADGSSRLQPLLEDLWQYESVVTLRGKPEQPDVLVAAKLDRTKADTWSKKLSQLAESWKLGSAS